MVFPLSISSSFAPTLPFKPTSFLPMSLEKYWALHKFGFHPCAGTKLIFSILFQFYNMWWSYYLFAVFNNVIWLLHIFLKDCKPLFIPLNSLFFDTNFSFYTLLSFLLFVLFYLYYCFACIFVCAPHVYWIAMWSALWMLGKEPRIYKSNKHP